MGLSRSKESSLDEEVTSMKLFVDELQFEKKEALRREKRLMKGAKQHVRRGDVETSKLQILKACREKDLATRLIAFIQTLEQVILDMEQADRMLQVSDKLNNFTQLLRHKLTKTLDGNENLSMDDFQDAIEDASVGMKYIESILETPTSHNVESEVTKILEQMLDEESIRCEKTLGEVPFGLNFPKAPETQIRL